MFSTRSVWNLVELYVLGQGTIWHFGVDPVFFLHFLWQIQDWAFTCKFPVNNSWILMKNISHIQETDIFECVKCGAAWLNLNFHAFFDYLFCYSLILEKKMLNLYLFAAAAHLWSRFVFTLISVSVEAALISCFQTSVSSTRVWVKTRVGRHASWLTCWKLAGVTFTVLFILV